MSCTRTSSGIKCVLAPYSYTNGTSEETAASTTALSVVGALIGVLVLGFGAALFCRRRAHRRNVGVAAAAQRERLIREELGDADGLDGEGAASLRNQLRAEWLRLTSGGPSEWGTAGGIRPEPDPWKDVSVPPPIA